VKTGVFPLKEWEDGRVVHTKTPRPRAPVEEYLRTQRRFAHLFEPARDEATLAEIQRRVDGYWEGVAT
jgi:pyruvate ferredoxin oxidoreductase beta subunit